ncbi:MAG: RIP metalloprotease RseP [Planctomycetes bacterium]|nr:RIP metalloprotease RseP [Planctomycetota bacterium]
MQFTSILWAALGIGLLIFVHELGHLLAARLAGVRVEVFSLGFGPRLAGVVLRGTDYRLSLVPFGGYVMVAGQDPGDRRYPAREALHSKTVGQRALFWSGGVLMNVLFALVVFPLVFHAGVPFVAPVVGSVDPGSAAWEAGIATGDRIVAVQGKAMYSFENLSVEIALHGGRPLTLALRGPDGAERSAVATPHFDAEAGLYTLGIRPAVVDEPPPLQVPATGPAAAAGVREGDRLVAVGGQRTTGGGLPAALRALAATDGAPLTMQLQRGEATVELTVPPRALPLAEQPPRLGVVPMADTVLGIRQDAAFVRRLGLRAGDRVLAIDGQRLLDGTLTTAASGQGPLRLLVQRGSERLPLEQPATAEERAELVRCVALGAVDTLQVVPAADSAALAAGVRAGDRVVAVDGQPLRTWSDLRSAIERAGDRAVRLSLQRPETAWQAHSGASGGGAEQPVELTVAPRREVAFDCGVVPMLTERREEVRAASLGEALQLGWVCSLDLVKQLYVTLKRVLTGDVGAKNLGGIIRISQFSYQAAQRGPSWFWYFLAMLSVNLGFVNLLPVPVLDGGHLLFLLIERIKGSPVSTRVLGYSQILGLVFVLLLVLFVTYHDILRLF